MRNTALALLAMVVALSSLIGLPGRAAAGWERPATLGISGGYRIFNSQLGLKNNAAAGLRLGLGITERFSLQLDYVFSVPVRENTDVFSGVSALRALLRYDLSTGATRPYLVAGVGGVMFNFGDAPDFSTGTLTGGIGVSHRLDRRLWLSLEGSADAYRARTETFAITGYRLSTGPRTTNALGTLTGSLVIRF